MDNRAAALAKLLESLSRIVASLDNEKLDALLAGDFNLEVAGGEVNPKPKTRREARRPRPVLQSNDLIAKLRESTSLEEGEQLLKGLDKNSLRSIAKYVHVRPNRMDDAEALINKIVRQTIGQRVSREAIRGTSIVSPTAVPIQPEDRRKDVIASENREKPVADLEQTAEPGSAADRPRE